MRLLLCHASSNIGVDGWWCVERKRMHEIKKEELNSLGQDASCTVAHPLEPATVRERERGWEQAPPVETAVSSASQLLGTSLYVLRFSGPLCKP